MPLKTLIKKLCKMTGLRILTILMILYFLERSLISQEFVSWMCCTATIDIIYAAMHGVLSLNLTNELRILVPIQNPDIIIMYCRILHGLTCSYNSILDNELTINFQSNSFGHQLKLSMEADHLLSPHFPATMKLLKESWAPELILPRAVTLTLHFLH